MAKKLSEDLKQRLVALHKDGVGYKKIAKTLKLSCRMVAKTKQQFNSTGSTQNRPHRARPKKLSARAQFGNECCQHCCRGWGVGQSVSAQTIRHTLHQIGLHGCRPRRKPLLKMMPKKARKQFAEDKQTNGAFPLHGTARYGSVRFTFGGFSTEYCTWYLILF